MAAWDDLSLQEQADIAAYAVRAGYVSWPASLGPYILVPPVFAVTAALAPRVFSLGLTTGWERVLLVASIVISVVIARLIDRRLHHRAYRRAMRDLGHRVCVACGYRTDGLSEAAACPECGSSPVREA